LIEDFKLINKDFSKEITNLFSILRLKILWNNYNIKTIKKVWINYQIDFNDRITVEMLKSFLELDFDANFVVIWVNRIRASVRNYKTDEDFIDYLLRMFSWKWKSKIKIKKI
jgi:hypothetical protein